MDLNAPLGVIPPTKPPRRLGLISIACGVALVAGVAAGASFLLSRDDQRAGRPFAVASIPAPEPVKKPVAQVAPSAADPVTASIPPRSAPLSIDSIAPQVTSGNGPLIIDVAKALADRRHSGMVAPPVTAGSSGMEAPRVAIFVAGMGLDPGVTRTAMDVMPSAVSLAFVPYGSAVAGAVAVAKEKGHEILLQIPMQSKVGSLPGPHALRPGESAQAIAADTDWAMSRFGGYAGVTNLLGAAVTSDRAAMSALLKIVAARGLFFIDDGTSRRSLAPLLAGEAGLQPASVDVVLDATSDPATVRANLEALVAIAERKGSAIGMASGLPDHLAAIASFAASLAARHVELVPVGALIAHGNATVAGAR